MSNNKQSIDYHNQFGKKLDCNIEKSGNNTICDNYNLQHLSWKNKSCIGSDNTKPCRPSLCVTKSECCVNNANSDATYFYLKK